MCLLPKQREMDKHKRKYKPIRYVLRSLFHKWGIAWLIVNTTFEKKYVSESDILGPINKMSSLRKLTSKQGMKLYGV